MTKGQLYAHLREMHPLMQKSPVQQNPVQQSSLTPPVKPSSTESYEFSIADINRFVEDNALKSYEIAKKNFDISFEKIQPLIIEIMRERQALYTTFLIQRQKEQNIKEMKR
ncbi:MAG: hypothetical protein QXP04_03920 [Candidatus Nanoarchaeia archaeon]|nr:hypothetical protein [Candidatus Jingweiarchaeum tengchongense]